MESEDAGFLDVGPSGTILVHGKSSTIRFLSDPEAERQITVEVVGRITGRETFS